MHGQDLIDRIIQRRGAVVNTTDEETYVLSALNEVYREVLAYHEWPWLIDHQYIRTWPLWSGTGDVTVTDATVDNLSPSFDTATERTAYTGGYFVGPSREFHRIESFTDADTLELSEDWIGSTDTGVTIEIWQDTYSMGIGCEHILTVGDPHEENTGYQLTELSEYEINRFVADRRQPDTTHLIHWARNGIDSTSAPCIRIWPVPRESTYLDVTYKRRPDDVANSSSSIPALPLRWHHVLVIGTIAKLAEDDGIEDQATLRLKAGYLSELERMVGELAKKSVEPRRLGRWDQAYPAGRDPNRWWQFVVQ